MTFNSKYKSIRFQIMAMLILINCIIVILLSASVFHFYKNSFIQEIATTRSDVLKQISERARQFKINVDTISNLYWNDSEFQEMADNLTDENSEEFFAKMEEMSYQIGKSFDQINLDFYVCFLSKNGIGYSSIPVPEGYDYMNPETKIWYREMYESGGAIVPIASYRDRMLGINSYTAARTVQNQEHETVGYLMINANERQLYQMYEEVINYGSSIYIVNDNGKIVSSNDKDIVGFSYFNMPNLNERFGDKDYAIIDIANHTSLFTRHYDSISGFTVFEDIPLKNVLSPIQRVRNIVVLLSFLSMIAGAVVAWHFSKKIAMPIQKLCVDIREVERGNLNQDFVIDSFSEINELASGMERMLRQIRILIESVHKKEEQKRRMELNWLQAQINPHFMYNTLFSIKCMVDMNQNEEAGNMIMIFIRILKGVLQKPDEMTTIEMQMESLKQYVELQKYLYGNSFELFIEYDEQLAEYKIPKLLLQPLVENAIVHGFRDAKKDKILSIIACEKEDIVLISIEDNGIGMSSEQIEKVYQKDTEKMSFHLGIRNVMERIQLYYGEAGRMEIKSDAETGTKITISIPFQK